MKNEMPDNIISISFNTASPFKLCHIKYLRHFRNRSVPPETLPLAKDLCERSSDKYIGVPMFSASLFPATGFAHLSLPLGRLGCKEEHS